MKSGLRLLIDARNGIYIPKKFVADFDLNLWQGVNEFCAGVLRKGPDASNYWDVWDVVLDNASFTEDGNVWTLHQDGDLWAVCPALMSNEEYQNFFGEMKPVPDDAYEYEVCDTCLMVLANDEAGDVPADEENAARAGIAALQDEFDIVDPDGSDFGFSWQACETCGGLAGNRYRVICSNLVKETT